MVRKPLIYDQFGKYLLRAFNMHPAYYLHFCANSTTTKFPKPNQISIKANLNS